MTGFVRGMAAAVAMAALVAATSYTTVRCHYQPPGTLCATYAGSVERPTSSGDVSSSSVTTNSTPVV